MTTLVEISKRRSPRLTPEQEAQQKRERTQARVGLASNVLGLSAGAAATGAALRDPRFKKKKAGSAANKVARFGERLPQPIQRMTRKATPKQAALLAGGALGLQVANVGGDVVANRVLARSASQAEGKVKKGLSLGKLIGTGKIKAGEIPKDVTEAIMPGAKATAIHNKGGWAVKRGTRVYGRAKVKPADLGLEGKGKAAHVKVKSKQGGGLTTAGKLVYVGAPTAAVVGGGTAAAVHHRRKGEDVDKGMSLVDGYIAKADHTKGKGRSYNDMSDDEWDARVRHETRAVRRGLVAGSGIGGAMMGGLVGAAAGPPKKMGSRAAIGAGIGGAGLAGVQHAMNESTVRRAKRDPVKRYAVEQNIRAHDRLRERALAAQARRDKVGKAHLPVGKAYRRYDPEADRQRRLGLAAGAGLLGAGLTGQAAVRRMEAVRDTGKKGAPGGIRGIRVKSGKGRGAALYTLAAAGSGAAGVGAYRKGISERNNPWN